MFVVWEYKGSGGVLDISPFSSLHHYHHYYFHAMSSPSPAYTSFLFSFRGDAPASQVVEAMEQVGGPASLSLN